MTDYLDKLSRFVTETCYEYLSPEAISATKDVILDTVGAILGGSLSEASTVSNRTISSTTLAAGTTMRPWTPFSTSVVRRGSSLKRWPP